ncbi:hypothetical protein EVB87_190 [Rhizobium phage RHph_N28_1]|nr:hypothetical protein EVB87_190 [Rhizobium phage RHph_N28_1]QIG74219.1 hypothetical protein EVC07_191 [Rhizobium phage RHph_N42]
MPKIKISRQVEKTVLVEVNFPLFLEQDYGNQEDGGSRIVRIDAQGNLLMVDQNYVNDGTETAIFAFVSKRINLKYDLDSYLSGGEGVLWFDSSEEAFRKSLSDAIYQQQKTLFAMDDAPKPVATGKTTTAKNMSLDTDE